MNARSLILTAGVFGALLLTGCPKPVEPIAPPSPPRIDRFEVSTTEAAPGQTVTLSWTVSDATSITLEQLGAGPLSASGNEGQLDVTLGDRDAVFALVAHGHGGSDSRVLRVNVDAQDPLLVVAAIPSHIAAGESAVLVYSGPQGSQLVDDAGETLVANAATSGSLAVFPRFSTTYTMKTTDQEAKATLTVAPGILELSATRVQGASGSVRVTWKAGGGNTLTLEGGGRGELFASPSREVIAEGSFDDVIPQGLPDDAQLQYTLRISDGATVAAREVSVRVGGVAAIDSFTAPEWAKLGGQLALEWRTHGAVRAELWQGTTQLFEAANQAEVSAGSFYPNTPTEKTTYELRVFDASGNMAVAQATTTPVGAPALVVFDADTTTIAQGGLPVTLTWEVTNARSMRIVATGKHLVHEAVGVAAEKGSVVVYPNAASVEYVLTADNTVGDAIPAASRAITVTAVSGVATWPEKVPLPYSAPAAEAQIASTQVQNVVGYAGFPTVEKNVPGEAFVDVRSFGVDALFSATEDTGYETVAVPALYTGVLFGKRVAPDPLKLEQYIHISANGWFAINNNKYGTSGPDTNAQGFPGKGLLEQAIAPYFDDLKMTPEGRVHVAAVGSGEGRRLVVQYSDVTLERVPGSRLTFQAQVFFSGKVVFAYQKLDGVLDPSPKIGVQDPTKSVAVLAPDVPAVGDTYTFFGPTQSPPPYPVTTSGYLGRMLIAGGGFMEFDAKPVALTTNLLYVSEVNPVSTVAGGEWVELTSVATVPINLRGFAFAFGEGQRRAITSDLVIPAGGRVLLAQSPGAGEGLPVDYVYGTDIDMPDTAATIGLMSGGYSYLSFGWAAGQVGAPGVSLRLDTVKQAAPMVYNSSSKGLLCPGQVPYGTHGQLGSPGAADTTSCFPYALQPSGGSAFEALRLTGQRLTVTQNRGEIFIVELPFAVRVGHRVSSTVYVSSNGFLTLEPTNCVASSSGCLSSNDSTPDGDEPNGTVAVFWDAMDYGKAPLGAMFWEARDPDGVAASGDEYALFSWENVGLYSSSSTYTSDLNFQARLTLVGDIELRYGSMTATTASHAKGNSATVWLEDPTGMGALKVHTGTIGTTNPGISPNTVKLLTWEP